MTTLCKVAQFTITQQPCFLERSGDVVYLYCSFVLAVLLQDLDIRTGPQSEEEVAHYALRERRQGSVIHLDHLLLADAVNK